MARAAAPMRALPAALIGLSEYGGVLLPWLGQTTCKEPLRLSPTFRMHERF
jgi:hypothetical protein